MQLELSELDLRYAELRITDPNRQQRLLASLSEHGQQTPVMVVRDGAAWVLIDGYVRVAALRKLACDLVEVAVLDVPEAEALVLAHGLDNGRARTALEEGWLLRELTSANRRLIQLRVRSSRRASSACARPWRSDPLNN